MNPHEICDMEKHTTFGEIYQGPTCEACNSPMLYDDGICDDCRTRQLECEQDEAWPVYKDSLRYGQDQIQAISDRLDGWQYIGGDVRYEKDGSKKRVAHANQLQFINGKCAVVFSFDTLGRPLITIYKGNPAFHDWQASFSCHTPAEIIISAAQAAV
jgi:hypothetical protein